jgi:hypothetical protein
VISTPRRLVPLALAGIATVAAIALVAIVVLVILPGLAPALPIGRVSTTLGGTGGPVTISYRMPEAMRLSIDATFASGEGTPRAIIGFTQRGTGAYGFGPLGEFPEERVFQEGSRGVVIADVTQTTLHGMERRPLGNDARTFLEDLDATPFYDVADISPATIGDLPAVSGTPTRGADTITHLDDTEGQATHIELLHPSHLIVADAGRTVVMIQIWARTAAELDAWLPAASELVDSIEISSAS